MIKALVLLSDKEDGMLEPCATRHVDATSPFPVLKHPNAPFGLQSVLDVTHHPAFQTATGCTERDVRDLDKALAQSFPTATGDIFEILDNDPRKPIPVSFVDPNWAEDLDLEHPLRAAQLCTDEADVGVYPLEPVLDALNEKYQLATKNNNNS